MSIYICISTHLHGLPSTISQKKTDNIKKLAYSVVFRRVSISYMHLTSICILATYIWINEWMNERTNERTNERDEWANEWTNERVNEWTNEWTNKLKNEWTNKSTNQPPPEKLLLRSIIRATRFRFKQIQLQASQVFILSAQYYPIHSPILPQPLTNTTPVTHRVQLDCWLSLKWECDFEGAKLYRDIDVKLKLWTLVVSQSCSHFEKKVSFRCKMNYKYDNYAEELTLDSSSSFDLVSSSCVWSCCLVLEKVPKLLSASCSWRCSSMFSWLRRAFRLFRSWLLRVSSSTWDLNLRSWSSADSSLDSA